MTKPQILFVDDEKNVLQGLRRSLRSMRHQWTMHFAEGGAAGLEVLQDAPIDMIVSDMRMPEMDGAQLLEKVRTEYPSTGRFVLSGQADRETTYRSIGPSHRFFSKPYDGEVFTQAVQHVLDARSSLSAEAITAVSRLQCVPTPEETREAFRAAMARDNQTVDDVADIIASDVGLSLKVLQLTNSSYFGHGGDVCCPRQAVRMLDLAVLEELAEQRRLSVGLVRSERAEAFQALCREAVDASSDGPLGLFSTLDRMLCLTEDGACLGDQGRDAAAYLTTLWGMPADIRELFSAKTVASDTEQRPLVA